MRPIHLPYSAYTSAGLPACRPPACQHSCRPLLAASGAKEFVSWTDVAARVPALLEEIQADMFTAAKAKFDACLEKVTGRGCCACAHMHTWPGHGAGCCWCSDAVG